MRFPLFAAAAIGLFSLSLTAHADLTGSQVDIQYYFPDTSTLRFDAGTQVVPTGDVVVANGGGYVNITGSQITLVSLVDQDFPSAAFNGFIFTDTSDNPMITGITLDPFLSTLFDAQGTFTSNSVSINLQGLGRISAGDSVTYDLQFAPPAAATPEPSSVALLGTGLLGLGGVMRRRFARI